LQQIVAQTSECGGFSTVLADLLHEQPLDKKSDLLAPAYAPYRTPSPPLVFIFVFVFVLFY
jgi:hypothetical protein